MSDPLAVAKDSPVGQNRLRLVEQTSQALQGAVELEAVLSVTLKSLVPGLADLAVLVLDERAGGPRVEAAHARPSMTPRLRREVARSEAYAAKAKEMGLQPVYIAPDAVAKHMDSEIGWLQVNVPK
jgi:hypothetical protein